VCPIGANVCVFINSRRGCIARRKSNAVADSLSCKFPKGLVVGNITFMLQDGENENPRLFTRDER